MVFSHESCITGLSTCRAIDPYQKRAINKILWVVPFLIAGHKLFSFIQRFELAVQKWKLPHAANLMKYNYFTMLLLGHGDSVQVIWPQATHCISGYWAFKIKMKMTNLISVVFYPRAPLQSTVAGNTSANSCTIIKASFNPRSSKYYQRPTRAVSDQTFWSEDLHQRLIIHTRTRV